MYLPRDRKFICDVRGHLSCNAVSLINASDREELCCYYSYMNLEKKAAMDIDTSTIPKGDHCYTCGIFLKGNEE